MSRVLGITLIGVGYSPWNDKFVNTRVQQVCSQVLFEAVGFCNNSKPDNAAKPPTQA